MTQRVFAMPAANGGKVDVTVGAGSSIGTDVVRVLVDDATAANKTLVLNALEQVMNRLREAAWPLA